MTTRSALTSKGARLAPGILGLLLLATAPALGAEHLPRPPELEPDVAFWIRIYSEVGTDGGLIHDARDLGIVYERVRFPDGLSRRGRERHTERIKERYERILHALARGKRSGLSRDEARVLRLFPDGVGNDTLRRSASRLRFQLGQADKFRAGVIRAGAYLPHIRRVLADMGLPPELAALPHVESSYTPHVYSRVGAAGLWQFTRSTGRRFMRVDNVVDERLDPFRASEAAARLLQQNYRVTGTWPLAITAYNHGASGMRRATRKLGTRDIATIVRRYRSRTFGFASRNFYVEFLAAHHVASNAERYFGPLRPEVPEDVVTFELPYYTSGQSLAEALGVPRSALRAANPALRRSVWNGSKYVPKGFTLRLPRTQLARPVETAIASVPGAARARAQKRDTIHVVRRGENLSEIARRYEVRQTEIVHLNGLRSRHRIRAGQRLRLPVDGSPATRTARAAARIRREAPPASGRYTVARGDTIEGIARRFGIDPHELARANGLRNRHRIYVGQKLDVGAPEPAATETASTSTSSAPAASGKPEPAEPERTEESPSEGAHPHAVAALTPGRFADRVEAAVPEAEPGEAPEESLLADPSDYRVHADGTIEVQAAETLGHYAEWLDLRASRLRRINGMRFGQPIAVGRSLKLDFGRVTPETFEHRRVEHHRALQEEFFASFEIAGTREHVIRRGDSLWSLSRQRYQVPVWLLRQYNPDLDFEGLHAGQRIVIPEIRPHDGTASPTAVSAPATAAAS